MEYNIVRGIEFDQVQPTQRGRMGKIRVSRVDNMSENTWLDFSTLPVQWNDLLNRNTESYESSREQQREYRDPEHLLSIISGVNNVILGDYELAPLHKYSDYEDVRLFGSFNIKPSSYREEDKWRYNDRMTRTKEYLEQEGDSPSWVTIW